MNLARVDLNLLLVFDAVMRERHVTRAAHRLGMTQPAVSNALGRLRLTLRDELFVRAADGMQPTPRALELSGPLHTALRRIEDALDPSVFDPATTTRTFRLGTDEYFTALMLERLLTRLHAEAPLARLHSMPLTRHTLAPWLDDGTIDVAVSPRQPPGEQYHAHRLFPDRYVVAMRRGHPLAAGGGLDLDSYCAAEHMLITMTGDTLSSVEDAVRAQGRERRIVVTVNQHLVALRMAGRSDLLLTAPGHLIARYQDDYGLHVVPLPLDVPLDDMRMVWHAQLGTHPALAWFRALIADESECARNNGRD